MKTKLLSTILLAIFSLSANAQSPNWQWAKSAGGTSDDRGNSISMDAIGNIYVTGNFSDTTITFGSYTLTNAGVFVVKYDASGNALWAKDALGSGTGTGISLDANGNSFVTGYFFSPTITFGGTTLTNADTTGGSADIFVVKYNGAGNVVWAKSAGGIYYDNGIGISVDVNGNAYLTGGFQSNTISFGNTTLTNATTNGYADIFTAKLDSTGNAADIFPVENNFIDNIFPNPSNGILQLSLVNCQNAEIEIYNMLGEKMPQSVIPSVARNLTINMENSPKGIYFYKIISEEKNISTGKIIIQ